MYLHQTMEDTEHHVYEMAGVVPGDCFYTGKLVRFGYIELTEKESNFLPENGSIKGHEFHYFDSTANGDDCVALKPVSGKNMTVFLIKIHALWDFRIFIIHLRRNLRKIL